jgi:hypothetical protein
MHMTAALTLAALASSIEKTWESNRGSEHRGLIVASVVSAVCFLEAHINELFIETTNTVRDPRTTAAERRAAAMWTLEIPRTAKYPILRKYEVALALFDKLPFARDAQPYQDANLLVKLRNTLVHAEIKYGRISEPDPRDALQGKFELNPFPRETEDFFPHRCLGYGCAKWAVQTATAFADAFHARLQSNYFAPVYRHMKPEIKLP